MNTNQKGIKGQIEVISDLYNKECHAYLPFDDYSPVDVIALNPQGNTRRLQIKYKSLTKNKVYEIVAATVINRKNIKIDLSKIDGWAVYLLEFKHIIYIPVITDKYYYRINPNNLDTYKDLF